MMPFGFSAPFAAWLAFLAIPLVAFYFLKLKRPRVRIPSLVLWQQVLNDSRVNSPFQRFKRNLLLWLQLLLLVLLVLAAMQPYLRSGNPGRMNLPILIDCSASMASRESPSGSTRLDEARRRAMARIEGMVRGQRICLIAFGRTARRLTDFTDNKRELLAALDSLDVQDVESDVEDALRMAQALARATPVEEVLLLSDGNIPAASSVELPFVLTYGRIEVGGANAGITSLRAVRAGSTEWRVFVGVDASADYRGVARLEASIAGESLVREVLSPTLDDPERVVFIVPGEAASEIAIRLSMDEFDALPADNEAYLELPALRPASVFIPERLVAFRHAIESMEDVLLFSDANSKSAASLSCDVVVSDLLSDMEPAPPVSLTVGHIPASLTGVVARTTEPDRIVDWQRNDPLLQHVALNDVVLTAGSRFAVQAGSEVCEELGYRIVVHGEKGPLIVCRDTPKALQYSLLVDLEETTLPYRIGFPVMMANLVRISLKREGLTEASSARTGVLRGLSADPGESCPVRLPDGATKALLADQEGRLPGLAANRVGLYRFGGTVRREIGVALLSPLETGLVAVDRIDFAEVAVTAATGPIRSNRALWPVIALVGFVLLLIEWWFFHRIQNSIRR